MAALKKRQCEGRQKVQTLQKVYYNTNTVNTFMTKHQCLKYFWLYGKIFILFCGV